MSEGEKAQTGRRDFVLWLAETQRHRSIAMPKSFRVDRGWIQNPGLGGAAEYWSFAEIGLVYEPRSLAVSPDGKQVAVGTKSGDVHVVVWNHETGVWRDHHIRAEDVRAGGGAPESPPGAIRGLLFLDVDCLIAGWGNGCFSVIARPVEKAPEVRVAQPEVRHPATDWYLGTQRVSRLVPLFDPQAGPAASGDLVLAILNCGETCVLSRDGEGRYSARWHDGLCSEWESATGPPADALWAYGKLWLLTTRGALFECSPAGRSGELDLERSRLIRTLPSPRPNALFKRLASCEVGLSVLAADNVTFLWFSPLGGRSKRLEAGEVYWFPVPGALDCAACLPCSETADPAELCRRPITREDPVWTVVSTAQPGLRWVRWIYPDRGSKKKATARPRPESATGNFATPGGESILYLAFGRQAASAPLFLACGTRDHKLLISSVLDRHRCERELSDQIAWLLANAGAEEAHRLFCESPGLAWQCLVTQIRYAFGIMEKPGEAFLAPKASELFSFAERNDLLELASRLVKLHGLRRRPRPELDRELAKWVLHLLRRANELGADVAREVAETLYDRLQSAPTESREEELRLRSLANFLRKWVIHGHTYGDKRTQLHQVFEHNWKCGRKLDALVYLTRLMRGRYDTLWETALPTESWVPTVWGLVSDEEGMFSVASLGDGGLCALDTNGNVLSWEIGEACRQASDLTLSESRLRLERKDARQFASFYRHGPYARSLWLCRLPGELPDYLLIFGLKGWRAGDLHKEQKRRPATVYALGLRLLHQDGDPLRPVSTVRIERIQAVQSSCELYGLCCLEERREEGRFDCTLLAGTGGSWNPGGARQPTPFVELSVEVRKDGIGLVPRDPRVRRFEKGERYIVGQAALVPQAASNRCWSLATSVDAHGSVWVWGGFQDGSIRGYRREKNDPEGYLWYEGGRGPEGPRQRGLKATGPVWRLLAFRGADGRRMLAYGTGDGALGAVSIEDLETREPGAPLRFLLQLRGSAPVCGLAEYRDEGKRFLLAADQGGSISLFDLNPVQKPDTSAAAGRGVRGHRFSFPGVRMDQFRVQRPVRAIVPLQGRGGPPSFLVGTAEAGICQIELRFPFYSKRRREVPDLFRTLLETETGGRSVVSVLPPLEAAEAERVTHAHSWLRVLPVGDMSLMRFSLWDELSRAGGRFLNAPPREDLAGCFETYAGVLDQLVEEVYRRRPFTEDLAMAIWEECAKVASWLARRVLRMASEPQVGDTARPMRQHLEEYLELNTRCADLCNRWIGLEQSKQSTVLIDSFTALFDWTALALIAFDPPRGETAREVRDFLVYTLIQHRLTYPDTLVPLETLRVINLAISRAVVNVPTVIDSKRTFSIRPELREGGPGTVGFYDVMTMVGDVWERLSASLSYSDPLTVEITRFFSLTLLLLPDCALILGRVVSESRLTERAGLVRLIVDQARVLRRELQLPEVENRIAEGLNRFEAYISEDKIEVRLLTEARLQLAQGDTGSQLSDARMLAEQMHVFKAILWLEDLSRPGLFEGVSGEMADTVAWLAADGPPMFYQHSHAFLRRLDQLRDEVRRAAGLKARPREGENPKGGGMREIQGAIDRCDAVLRDLEAEHLYRPQRGQYELVIRGWRDQLVKQAGEAVVVLDIMDSFNRHVYRRSADALMDNVVNLAMQTAPVSYLDRVGPEDTGLSLRTRILKRLEGYPLISSVFEASEYLVQNTHLAGALLTIARHYTGTLEDPTHWSSLETIRAGEVEAIVREVARRVGLVQQEGWNIVPSYLKAELVPGTRVVWDLIVHEWATNILKHSYQGNPPGGRAAPFLNFEVQARAPGRAAVLLYSSVPYEHSLQGDELRRYRENRKECERSLERLFEPGRRGHHTDGRPGAGMGLFMIKRLAELWATMEVRLKLLGPEDPPLCLEITWSRRR